MKSYHEDIFKTLRNEADLLKINAPSPVLSNKVALNIEEQIQHLKENKNIHFGEYEEDAKKYLLKHSYADVITPLKVLFSSGYSEERKCHLYDTPTKWEDIRRIHEELQELELTLLQASLSLELELKSLFCEWLADFLKNERIDFVDFLNRLTNKKTNDENKLFLDLHNDKYTSIYDKEYSDYTNTTYINRWWLLIMAMSFGDFCILVTTHLNPRNPKEKLLHLICKKKDFKGLPDVHTINALRNSLAHNTNILICLDKPLRDNREENYQKRIASIKFLWGYCKPPKTINSRGVIFYYVDFRNNDSLRKFPTLKILDSK